MDYQVWTKNEYDEQYTKVDCGDLPAAKREIDIAIRQGGEPILTVKVPYELNIKISEVVNEAIKSNTEPDKSTRVKGKGEVRPGDNETVSELS